MEALEVVELWSDNASSLAISATVHCRRAWSLLNSPQKLCNKRVCDREFPSGMSSHDGLFRSGSEPDM